MAIGASIQQDRFLTFKLRVPGAVKALRCLAPQPWPDVEHDAKMGRRFVMNNTACISSGG